MTTSKHIRTPICAHVYAMMHQGNTVQATYDVIAYSVNNESPIAHTHTPTASCVVSSSRALSGSILLANHKDLKDVSLDSVRMLLLDDGANPCELQCTLTVLCVIKYYSHLCTSCDFGCI